MSLIDYKCFSKYNENVSKFNTLKFLNPIHGLHFRLHLLIAQDEEDSKQPFESDEFLEDEWLHVPIL